MRSFTFRGRVSSSSTPRAACRSSLSSSPATRAGRHPLDVVADQMRSGASGADADRRWSSRRLALERPRAACRIDLLAQLFDLACRDRLRRVARCRAAPAQQALAPLRIHLVFPGGGQRALRLGDRDLALEVLGDAREPERGLLFLEQRDPLLGRQRQRRRDQISEQARRGDALDEVLPLVGIVVVQIDHAVRQPTTRCQARRARRFGLPLVERIDRTRPELCPARALDPVRATRPRSLIALAFASITRTTRTMQPRMKLFVGKGSRWRRAGRRRSDHRGIFGAATSAAAIAGGTVTPG